MYDLCFYAVSKMKNKLDALKRLVFHVLVIENWLGYLDIALMEGAWAIGFEGLYVGRRCTIVESCHII